MDSLLFFFKIFTAGFSFSHFAWFFYYLITILILTAIYFKVRKHPILPKKLFCVIFIIGVLGTLYQLTYVFLSYGSPKLNSGDRTIHFVYDGLANALQPLVLVVFCWLIFSILDIFLKQNKEV